MSEVLKLIYPQWQGGDIASFFKDFFKDLPEKEIAQGYYLGAQILNLIVDSINPNLKNNEAIVPIEKEFYLDQKTKKRIVEEGIVDKKIIQKQTAAAFEILNQKQPQKVLTLGGECSVSIAPFSYLISKNKDVGLVWLDAHPDLGVPYDDFYQAYHAMAVSALRGDPALSFSFRLPAHLEGENILIAGLHSNEADHYSKRRESLGIAALTPSDLKEKPNSIIEWLKKRNIQKALIHLDLDCLNPAEIYAAVGNTGEFYLKDVAKIMGDIQKNTDIIGLTIAEHMPKTQIQLKMLFKDFPLIKNL